MRQTSRLRLFSNPVLYNILPIGPIMTSNSPLTRFDPSPSHLESHLSVKTTAAPCAPPAPTSAPDLCVAAEGDGSPKPELRKERDTLDSLNRAIHANSRVTLDFPPQSPSLPPVTDPDATTAGLSPQEPDAEHTGDHLRHPLLCSYDMV